MPVTIKPKKMLVSKNATRGGGGMDIATKRDALAERLAKTASTALKGSRLSEQDVTRAMNMARGMISPSAAKKAKGGKVKK
jgi:hypothetical protein